MDALGIANLALRRIGEKVIARLDDPDSTAARVCSTFLRPVMDEVTSEHDWWFATARAELVLDEDRANLTEYTYQYYIPDDCLRIRSVLPDYPYELEGNRLFSNTGDLVVVYTRSLVTEDTLGVPIVSDNLPSKFSQACALRLAVNINVSLNGRPEIQGSLQGEYMMLLTQAKNQSSMDSPGPDVPADAWEEVM